MYSGLYPTALWTRAPCCTYMCFKRPSGRLHHCSVLLVYSSFRICSWGMFGYMNNAISNPKYCAPLWVEGRERALYSKCSLGYFHSSEPGWSPRTLILSGFWESNKNKIKKILFVIFFLLLLLLLFLLLFICIVIRWNGVNNLWGNFVLNITLYNDSQNMGWDLHYIF